MRTEIPAYIVAVVAVIAATVLLMANKSVPTELYGVMFGSLGIAGGVSMPSKANNVPPAA